MLEELGHQVWIGTLPRFAAGLGRDRNGPTRCGADPGLVVEDEFPRIPASVPKAREVLRQCVTDIGGAQRTRAYNTLQAIALSAGVSLKAKLRTRKGQERLLGLW